ncbi:anaphase-promoting complex subunit 6-like isoform X1 [Rhododendron vialii]|uniref:anaphase-promoting complex subunit 6-like isoform X1 n=1 Tax=Rhododendron vialii TaxID=182163 RepID=UPI00265DDE44|nr:anaphase-promoting complex subunit 6-like isoform X1 [Rhododendron vialii]
MKNGFPMSAMRYHEAITYYEKVLALSTRSLSTYAGLAYPYHLQDNFTATIIYYHKALWLKPDDQFCTEMLTLALVDECRHGVEPKRIPVKTIYLYIENMKITANVVFYVANI